MMKGFIRFFFFVFLCFSCGCSLDKSSGIDNQPSGFISVYTLSPDAPGFNVFLNGNNVATGVPFGSYTLYSAVTPGSTTVRLQTGSQEVTIDTSIMISAGSYYSIFLTDSFKRIKPAFITDKLNPATDSVSLRFFNFSPDAPPVDIYSYSDSSNHKTIWKNRSFQDQITTDSINTFTGAKRGTYNFFVIKSGSIDTLAKFTGKTLTVAGNYTLFLEGNYKAPNGDTTLQLGVRLH